MKRFAVLFAVVSCPLWLIADEPPQPPTDNDPLLRALKELQREVDQLRDELRGKAPVPVPRPPGKPGKTPIDSMPARPGVDSSDITSDGPPVLKPIRRIGTPRVPLSPAAITPSDSEHWAFQPVSSPKIPRVENDQWCRDNVDRFLLARLEEAGLEPNPDADRYTLLRRVSFDLTGLPPSVEDIQKFVSNPKPLDDALAEVVDRFLDSPRFGERWGRHWLDVVRYADSVGRNWNAPFTYAWRYRDYVIDSLNQDKRFDRFITEQIAGDLLPAGDLQTRREQLVATGFLALGAMDIIEPEGESLMMDRVDEQIDVTTRAFMALTVACARCHDHKYEPVSMRDYYALAGIFYSTETMSGQRRGDYVTDDDLILLPSRDGRTSAVPGVHSMADMNREHRVGGWREVLWTTDPNLAMATGEGRVQDCPIRLDGEAYKRGPIPPRGDFHFAGLSGLANVAPDSSGRLELARWIASPDNPLTARVMVNRVWMHLFGRGLVETVDNFGLSGGTPSHPLLLDHLASRFQEDWSVKTLIRSIMLSRTYRLSSQASPAAMKTDAQNSLYWRMNSRRLEIEAVRDSMLSIAGRLSTERPAGIQIAGRGGKGKWGETRSLLSINSPYRTVYLPVLRSLLPEMYSTFDFPNPTQLKGQREVTTVAPQSLFLMNSDFAGRMPASAAERVLSEAHSGDAERIRVIYLRVLGRLPDSDEIQAATEFMESLTGQTSASYRWSTLIQALLISGEFRTLL